MKKLAKLFSIVMILLSVVMTGPLNANAQEGVTWEENLLDPENPVTVRFYSYTAGLAGAGDGINQLVENFNNGPGAEKGVTLEIVNDVDYQKSQADITAGLQVDMVQQTFSYGDSANLETAINSKGLSAFEDVFPQDLMTEHFEGIPENALNLGVIDDRMYGLAWTFSTPILYMNVSLLEEAGIEVDGPPADWNEMYEWAKQVSENTDAYGFALSPTNGWVDDSIFYSNGARQLSEDRTEAQFNSPEAVEALTMWKSLYQDGVGFSGTDNESVEAFMSGSAAMHIQSTSLYTAINDIFAQNEWKLDGYPMPGFDGNESIPTNSGSAITVRPDSEQKAQAVWEVVKYMTGADAYTVITSQIGYLPLRPELAEDPNYLKDFVDENPIIGRNIERLPHIQPATIYPAESMPEARQIYMDFIQRALTTDIDIQEAADEAVEQINSLLP